MSTVQTNTVTLTVTPVPLVLSGPSSATIEDEQLCNFQVAITTGRGPFTYQWYEVGVGAIVGETSDTLSFPVDYATDDQTQYYCDVTDGYSTTVSSATATLTVTKIPVVFVGPEDEQVTEWTQAQFSIAGTTAKSPITYQWIEVTAGILVGEIADTYTIAQVPPSEDGNQYYCQIVDGYGDVSDSPTALLTVDPIYVEKVIDVRVLDPDGNWVSIVGPPGEDAVAEDLIDDGIVSYSYTWSSEKISLELSRYVPWDQLPHALYGPQQSDVDTTAVLTQNAMLVWNAVAEKFIVEYPTIWRGAYELGRTYYKGDQVEAQGWLMTCNAIDGTEEPANPILTGPETFIFPEAPAWQTSIATGLITMTMKIIMNANLCQQFRIWPSKVGADVYHFVEVVIRRGGPTAIPVSRSYYNPILVADQWNVLQFADAPLSEGTLLDAFFHVIDETSQTIVPPHVWVYGGAGSNREPEAGEWVRTNDHRRIRTWKIDADGVDRTADLLSVEPGSRSYFEQEDAPERNSTYLVISDPVDQGDYVEYEVRRIEYNQNIQSNERTNISGIIPVPQATDYVKIPNYFPSGDPDWGTCTTLFEVDGVPTSEPNTTGYGIDVAAAPGVISEDWDYNNYSDVTPSPGLSVREKEFLSKQIGGRSTAPFVHRTTNGQWQSAISTTVPTDTVWNVRITIFAKRVDAGEFDFAKITLDGLFWNDGGSAGDDIPRIFDSATTNGLNARVSSAGSTISLDVNGKNNQDWDWYIFDFTEEIFNV